MAVRAAEYVRMSTDHQRYSTENQSAVIRDYATKRGFEIVRTYADEGKSGLRLDGRDALKQLIADVQGGRADFATILVYDVSRWGRFQDADESAYYEYICKRAGITVHYCAEQFENDGSPVSTIVKGVKRAMAGEYSRELSNKVFAGQCRHIERGVRQGGPAGFGLRRILVDENRQVKGELARGQHKSIQTDRVILAPGPSSEVEAVRWIYRTFVEEGRPEHEIASLLNARGILTDLGRSWTRGTVHQILINEKYVGHNVWNRRSYKLKKKHVRNPPDMWVRADGAFTPIVDQSLFDRAQAIVAARAQRVSDDELLAMLRTLLQEHGFLSGLIIDEQDGAPSSSAYRSRFGSLLRAYTLIGYAPARDYRHIQVNQALRRMHPDIVAGVIAGIESVGARVEHDHPTGLLHVNGEFTVSVVLARCRATKGGSRRWHLRLDTGLCPDITVAVRMNQDNHAAFDYYLLPRTDMTLPRLRLAEDNGISLDAYRYDTLDALFDLTARTSILKVA